MVVSSPYYQPDTITRVVKKMDREEVVNLHANDYALMIHYFSMSEVADWQKRRDKLEPMFEDSAMICQVMHDNQTSGMELFTKEEFIDKLTMPTGSLKNLEILDTKYRNDKISTLRFRINTTYR